MFVTLVPLIGIAAVRLFLARRTFRGRDACTFASLLISSIAVSVLLAVSALFARVAILGIPEFALPPTVIFVDIALRCVLRIRRYRTLRTFPQTRTAAALTILPTRTVLRTVVTLVAVTARVTT